MVTPVAAPTSTRILAVDERGALLEGAAIFTRSGGAWIVRGSTDRNGALDLELIRTGAIELVGRASGFTPVQASCAPPHPERLTLVFTPADRICVVVRTSGGAPPSAPVRVMVFSRKTTLEELVGRVERLTDSDPSLLLTVTDADGAFCIDGVNAG